jgi:hypothetical protein
MKLDNLQNINFLHIFPKFLTNIFHPAYNKVTLPIKNLQNTICPQNIPEHLFVFSVKNYSVRIGICHLSAHFLLVEIISKRI